MENDKIKLIVSEILEEKLAPINKNIDDIKTQLGNHISHQAFQLGELNGVFKELSTDVDWLKKLFDPKNSAINDATQAANIRWLTWAIRLMIGAVIANAVAMLYHLFFK